MYPTLHRLYHLLHGMAIDLGDSSAKAAAKGNAADADALNDLWRRVTLCKSLVQQAADAVPYATAPDAVPAVLAPTPSAATTATAAQQAAEGVTPNPTPDVPQ
jgi:hypothetical protein